MSQIYTKSIKNIQGKMQDMDEESIRYKILSSAKNFKISWIELGQALYTVWKDKMYKEWGYSTFEIYTAKEIGIKQATALKLLKSYYFLEKEEPILLQKELARDSSGETNVASAPSYESVNLLRLAKNKKMLDPADYHTLRKDVLESGKDVGEVRKNLTSIMKQHEEADPVEARENKRMATLKRLLGTVKNLKKELEIEKLASASTIKDLSMLIVKIESEIA